MKFSGGLLRYSGWAVFLFTLAMLQVPMAWIATEHFTAGGAERFPNTFRFGLVVGTLAAFSLGVTARLGLQRRDREAVNLIVAWLILAVVASAITWGLTALRAGTTFLLHLDS